MSHDSVSELYESACTDLCNGMYMWSILPNAVCVVVSDSVFAEYPRMILLAGGECTYNTSACLVGPDLLRKHLPPASTYGGLYTTRCDIPPACRNHYSTV